MKSKINELIKRVNKKLKTKKKTDWKKKYRELKKELDSEIEKNNKLIMEIDSLELLTDKDFKAKKIKNLEALLEDYRKNKHEMRKEIVELRNRINNK